MKAWQIALSVGATAMTSSAGRPSREGPRPIVTDSAERTDGEFDPWHPGIESRIPNELRHLATIFRPENVYTDVARAEELRDLTGLEFGELVAFRPGRLALHELLVRITADFSVPDGSKIEDLGINFRRITRVLLAACIEPRMAAIDAHYDTLRARLAELIDTELSALLPGNAESNAAAAATPRTGLRALFARDRRHAARDAVAGPPDPSSQARVISAWEAKGHSGADATVASACRALARVASVLLVRHGRVWGDRRTIAELATDIACNHLGSDEIGRLIEPWLHEAAAAEHYERLPRQAEPMVMNTKGASAAGKSTLRPLQKRLAADIGVDWSEFALISPDIWRKQLLDYGSLGAAYKYAGAFTGDELHIVDQKLDRYMARKADRGEMSHLLIDRFRFDSFAPDSDEAGSNLLTRFGRIVYLFFMITPPESLVVRAWKRGLEVGRYKAVDDTLAHGVEAYSGMPQLFFTWIQRADKRVHFEFLDNSVRARRAPAHRRVRLERQAQRARRLAHARHRAIPPRQRQRHGARVPVRRRGAPAAGEERRLSRCLHRPLSRGRFRRPGVGADLSARRCGRACLAGSRSAGQGDREPGRPRRSSRRRARRFRPPRAGGGPTRVLEETAGPGRIHTLGALGTRSPEPESGRPHDRTIKTSSFGASASSATAKSARSSPTR